VDVPDDIRSLLSPDDQVRSGALHRLYGSIFHQGTRWRASQHAVPFLFELAISAATPDRSKIVELIGHLAVGYHESWLQQGLDPNVFASGDAAFDAGDNEFQVDELDVYLAVCEHQSDLLSLATDHDPNVRHAVAYVLAFLPNLGERGLDTLLERIRVESGTLQANALIAAALLSQSLGLGDTISYDRYLDDSDPLVAYAAAVGRARLEGARRDDAVSLLIGAVVEPPVGDLYWNEGDLSGFAATSLTVATPRFDDELTSRLCGVLRGVDGPTALRLLEPLLRGVFHDAPPHLAQDLTSTQRRVVETLAESRKSWTWGGHRFVNFSQTVSGWGLPSTPEQVALYLAGQPIDELRTRRPNT
jgi:hypothetical protein